MQDSTNTACALLEVTGAQRVKPAIPAGARSRSPGGEHPRGAGDSLAPLGLLIEDFDSEYLRELERGMDETARSLNRRLHSVRGIWCARQEAEEIRALAAAGAGAVILTSGMLDDAMLERLSREIPVVLVARRLVSRRLHSLCVDNRAGACLAVKHLISLGHHRIAHIAGPSDQADARERLQGYRDAIEDAGLRFDPDLVVQGGFLEGGGLAAVLTLLKNATPFTAVFAGNDQSALGARVALLRYGIRVPDDISLVGFDDIDSAQRVEPALTTVRQPVHELGCSAARAAIALAAGEELPVSAALPVELIVRGSTRRLR
jgi:LacI family transcriptional regulator